MSAELLREAAKLMRERAERIPLGPWAPSRTSDDQFIVHGDNLHGEISADVFVHDGTRKVEFDASEAAAEHIASWHPAVALAVADWLDIAVKQWRNLGMAQRVAADLVARAYLGGDS